MRLKLSHKLATQLKEREKSMRLTKNLINRLTPTRTLAAILISSFIALLSAGIVSAKFQSRSASAGKQQSPAIVRAPLSKITAMPDDDSRDERAVADERERLLKIFGEEPERGGILGEGKVEHRKDWFGRRRAYPHVEIPPAALPRANEQIEAEEERLRMLRRNDAHQSAPETSGQAGQAVWTRLGPAPVRNGQTFGKHVPVSGRVTAIALHPSYNGTTNQTVYIGTAHGGVWRSMDNGTTWTNLTEDQPSQVIGALAIDPTNPNVIYAGTGESKVASYTGSYYGAGLLKSADGGATWTVIAGPAAPAGPHHPVFLYAGFSRIAIDPVTPSTIFAATTYGKTLQATHSESLAPLGPRGIWRSSDGGRSWVNVNVSGTADPHSATDVLIDPTDHNRIFAVLFRNGVYRSTAGGAPGTWTELAGGLPNAAYWDRGILAAGPPLSPGAAPTLYAAFSASNQTLLGIYRSTDGGGSWTTLARPQLLGQASYNLALAVDPIDANLVYYGTQPNAEQTGGSLWRSTNGGQSWTDISRGDGTGGLHGDTQVIVVSPANRNIVFTGDDGGIFRSDNATGASVGWTSLNHTLDITQFIAVAVHPTNPNILIGGTHDNGTNLFTGNPMWERVAGGDGGFTLIDQSNPQVMYHTFYNLTFHNLTGRSGIIGYEISTDGGRTWDRSPLCIGCAVTPGKINPYDRVEFYAPMALNPAFAGPNGNVIYFGTHRLYRSANRGATWTGVGPSADGFGADLTKGPDKSPNQFEYALSAITAHPVLDQSVNPPGEIVWAGTTDGNVQITTDAGALGNATWTNVTKAPLPNRVVSGIAIDPNNRQRAIVAFSGFGERTPETPGHVFLTDNLGGSWTDISGNLPDLPVNSVVIDPHRPNTCYIGTDLGVFRTTDGGATWERLGEGMPKIAVFMLQYHAATRTLVAATHGRGVFRLSLADPPPGQTEELKADDGTLETGALANGVIVVNRLTPSSYPATLQKIRIFAAQAQGQPSPSGAQIRLVAFNASSDKPPASPTLLVDQPVTIPPLLAAGFVDFTIQNPPAINSGDWFVGFQAPNPANGVVFWLDTNGQQQQRSFFSTDNGANYQGPLAVGNPPALANALIRAVVTTGTGSQCSYSISPGSQSFNANGGSGSANVTTGVSCNWTVKSNADWITINSGSQGSGPGLVNYAVAANSGSNSRTGTLTVAGQTFTVTQAGSTPTGNRIVRLGQASGSPGGQASVPVELIAQGDENALGFSLTFDPAALGNPQAAMGNDAANATLNVNTNQLGQGRLGIVLSLPTGQKFGAGVRQIAVVNFAIAGGVTVNSTPIGFGDQPVAREVSDTNANALPANYTPGTVTITSGFEGDVAPRPNGNGSVTITDWVQIGRFVAGQDTPGGSEFQRADTAPRETRGNGALTITDWVQAGRYAAGLDPLTTTGGPIGPTTSGLTARAEFEQHTATRRVRVTDGADGRADRIAVAIELDAQGNENALGFSAAGQRQIIRLTFAAAPNSNAAAAMIEFGDQLLAREVSDTNARTLPASFIGGKVTPARNFGRLIAR